VHLDDGEITTSVGVAAGGDIAIDPVFVILQLGSRVSAEAGTGHGGRIQIAADNFIQFPGSVVSADSGVPELSGTVEIHSPDVNLAGTLAELPSSFLDAASLMRERCAARRSGERSGTFTVRGPGGIPAEPDGWLPAPLLPESVATAAAPEQPTLVASLPGPLLLHAGCP
jgi:large exoprotein involved in heme utilization and adhesion